eukprot:CAMPEP_0174849118 /NCGR_PEP_ID=MMETSP1114-20130205/13906_1 /TAXON_ID=312471 /ORGANISM="Neobodo designis, Strain CCAP 1951/1" /LENGTH=492 /DNA_ID=CAMNT_0016083429 /DNA_START=38 /DNA_END=1516 /DNA_ORIENTATION=+
MFNPVSLLWNLAERGWTFLQYEIEHHPAHVVIDAVMVLAVIYVIRMPVHKAKDPAKDRPTKEEEEMLIAEFQSQPFAVPERQDLPDAPVVAEYKGVRATLESGQEVLNLSSFDFLAYATAPNVIEAAQETIVRYGCGSCGPRGFYGSLKPHIDLEERLAKFMGTAAGIIYSFSFATISTLIPCFSARGDEIIVDSDSHLAIQIGCRLSRSQVEYFRHNDVDHVEQLMKASHAKQKKKGKRTPPRRALVIEGVYRNSGCLANLPKLVALAKQYKYRVILDDSLGFAVLGKTGRGTPEHFGVPIEDIDVYVGAMSTSLGTVGGFCVGAAAMIDHQRLAATGYVFSAALPPYASVAAITILDMLDESPKRVVQLQRNASTFRKLFIEKKVALPKGVVLRHDASSLQSPVVHFTAPIDAKLTGEAKKAAYDDARAKFFAAADGLLADGVMVAAVKYNDQERDEPAPSLRVTMKSELSELDVEKAAKTVAAGLAKHF